jgi:hypothetical protein
MPSLYSQGINRGPHLILTQKFDAENANEALEVSDSGPVFQKFIPGVNNGSSLFSPRSTTKAGSLSCDMWWRALFEVQGSGLLVVNSAGHQAAQQPTSLAPTSGFVWSTCGTAFGITADFNNRANLAGSSCVLDNKKLLGSLSKFRRQLKAHGFREGRRTTEDRLGRIASLQSDMKKCRLSDENGAEVVAEAQRDDGDVKIGFSFSSLPGSPCPDVEFPAGLVVLHAYAMEGITSSAPWSSYAQAQAACLRPSF